MSDVSNDRIYETLLGIKEDIGTLNAKADTAAELLAKHEIRVSNLEAGANRQKGAAKVMALLATALGAVGGLVMTWLTRGNN
jgi:hypothetical protein